MSGSPVCITSSKTTFRSSSTLPSWNTRQSSHYLLMRLWGRGRSAEATGPRGFGQGGYGSRIQAAGLWIPSKTAMGGQETKRKRAYRWTVPALSPAPGMAAIRLTVPGLSPILCNTLSRGSVKRSASPEGDEWAWRRHRAALSIRGGIKGLEARRILPLYLDAFHTATGYPIATWHSTTARR